MGRMHCGPRGLSNLVLRRRGVWGLAALGFPAWWTPLTDAARRGRPEIIERDDGFLSTAMLIYSRLSVAEFRRAPGAPLGAGACPRCGRRRWPGGARAPGAWP